MQGEHPTALRAHPEPQGMSQTRAGIWELSLTSFSPPFEHHQPQSWAHPGVNTHLPHTCKMPARLCKHCLHGFLCKQLLKTFFFLCLVFFFMGKCPQRHTPCISNRVECIKSSSESGNGSLAEAWRGDARHGPGAQPAPACRLGSPGGSGTRLQPGQSLALAPGCCRHSRAEIQLLLSQCHGKRGAEAPNPKRWQ